MRWKSVCISVYGQLVLSCINYKSLCETRGLVIFLVCFSTTFWDIILSSFPSVLWAPSDLSASPSCPRSRVDYIQNCPLDLLSFLSLISLGATFMLDFLPMVIMAAGIHLRDYN